MSDASAQLTFASCLAWWRTLLVASDLHFARPMTGGEKSKRKHDRKPIGAWLESAGLAAVLAAAIALALSGCGGSQQDADLRAAGGIPVKGAAGFGSQCPYGSIGQPVPTKLELWNCPIGLDRLELAQPLEPLFIMGDCKRKTITVRMDGYKMDSAWEVMPDGSFFFTVDGGVAELASDGPNRGACSTALTADLMGKMDCTNVDKAVISFETVWWLGKSVNPDRALTGSACQVPSSCYLYASTVVNQCS